MSKDPTVIDKVINGMGYRGRVDYKQYQNEYDVWKNMIYRCYRPVNKLYPYYGGQGITIDDRWLCFELFLYDLVQLPNYEKMHSARNARYNIDIISKQDRIPIEKRKYQAGKIEIKEYYRTDLYSAECRYNRGEVPKNQNQSIYSDEYIKRQQNASTYGRREEPKSSYDFKQNPDGSWPMEAYEAVIKNPPKLPIPSIDDLGHNKVRVFLGIKYLDRPPLTPVPHNGIHRKDGKKCMCMVIDKKKEIDLNKVIDLLPELQII
jgi:hypothetical protein